MQSERELRELYARQLIFFSPANYLKEQTTFLYLQEQKAQDIYDRLGLCLKLEFLEFQIACFWRGINPRTYEMIGINHPDHIKSLYGNNNTDIIMPSWSINPQTLRPERCEREWEHDTRVVIWRRKVSKAV